MHYFLAIVFFFITLAATFVGFIISIATAKEGIAWSDMWIYGAIVLTFFILIAIWIWIFRKFSSLFFKILAGFGIFFISFPLIIVLLTGGIFIYEGVQGKLYRGSVAVNDYKETFITWPSLPNPVGVHIELEVPSQSLPNRKARYTPPMIWMGPQRSVPYDPYYYIYNANVKDQPVVLSQVFLNKQKPNLGPEVFSLGESTKIIVDLYPGIITYIESPEAFCTQPELGKGRSTYANGTQLNSQMFWYYGKEQVDASPFLTPLLQKNSRLQGNPELWTKIHQQFEDESLLKSGFHACTLQARQHCFCKTLN